jgi:LysM repeat protein
MILPGVEDMKSWKRLLYYLLINIAVSACATLGVLVLWDRTHPPEAVGVAPITFNPTVVGTPAAQGTPGAVGTPQTSPTALPTADIYKNVQAYQVQPGDTLGDIAAKFDVSVEQIMSFNGLKDANSLGAGQVVYIPGTQVTIPVTAAAPTATYTPAAPSPTPPGFQPAPTVSINAIIGAGDVTTEHVFITRGGTGELSLEGWQMVDENGNVYTFPQLVLYEGGAVNVWTSAGSPTVIDLYWGLNQPVWTPGETATLRDAQGKVRATAKVP